MSEKERDKDKDKTIGNLLKKVVNSNAMENLGDFIETAKNTNSDLVGLAKTEVKSYLEKINISKEIDRILDNYDIEVKGTLSFKKKKTAEKSVKEDEE